jgi:hypothetical protein
MARANCSGVIKAILEGKACGMHISKKSIAEYEKYSDMIDELCIRGCEKNTAYNLIHITVVRAGATKNGINLFSLKKSSSIRKRIMDYLFSCAVSGKQTTRKGYVAIAGTRKDWSDTEYDEHYTPLAISQIKKVRAIERHKTRILNGVDNPNAGHYFESNTGVTRKMGALSSLCTTGQTNILFSMVERGYGDNAYESFCIALKWASEKLDSEKLNEGDHDNLPTS